MGGERSSQLSDSFLEGGVLFYEFCVLVVSFLPIFPVLFFKVEHHLQDKGCSGICNGLAEEGAVRAGQWGGVAESAFRLNVTVMRCWLLASCWPFLGFTSGLAVGIAVSSGVGSGGKHIPP